MKTCRLINLQKCKQNNFIELISPNTKTSKNMQTKTKFLDKLFIMEFFSLKCTITVRHKVRDSVFVSIQVFNFIQKQKPRAFFPFREIILFWCKHRVFCHRARVKQILGFVKIKKIPDRNLSITFSAICVGSEIYSFSARVHYNFPLHSQSYQNNKFISIVSNVFFSHHRSKNFV